MELVPWPSKGADCNPIENLWAAMVNTWEPELERNPHELVAHAERVWEIFRGNPALVHKYTSNMTRRLQGVIAKEGGWTKY